jgi:hypothetical protein
MVSGVEFEHVAMGDDVLQPDGLPDRTLKA